MLYRAPGRASRAHFPPQSLLLLSEHRGHLHALQSLEALVGNTLPPKTLRIPDKALSDSTQRKQVCTTHVPSMPQTTTPACLTLTSPYRVHQQKTIRPLDLWPGRVTTSHRSLPSCEGSGDCKGSRGAGKPPPW